MTERKIMKLASRGKRFGAACIDAFVPVVSYMLYTAVMAANGIKPYNPGYGYGYDPGYGYGYGFDYGYGIGSNRLTGASAAIMVVVFFILLAYIVTELVMFARGKSIGKAILGLQVVSSKNGKPFRFWKMLFRECFVKSASGSVLGLGYIWVLIDDKNRGWHDKILDSYVVDVRESERMNFSRQTGNIQSAAPAPEPVPAPAAEPSPEPEIKEAEPVVPETIEETVIEITPDAGEAFPVEVPADTAEEIPEVTAEETEPDAKPEKTGLSMSMKKEELLEAARERGVQVSARATKAAILEAIEKAADTEEKEKDLEA